MFFVICLAAIWFDAGTIPPPTHSSMAPAKTLPDTRQTRTNHSIDWHFFFFSLCSLFVLDKIDIKHVVIITRARRAPFGTVKTNRNAPCAGRMNTQSDWKWKVTKQVTRNVKKQNDSHTQTIFSDIFFVLFYFFILWLLLWHAHTFY